ncbi:hypothetical protein A0H81_13989, partial [Grifola frondosa]
ISLTSTRTALTSPYRRLRVPAWRSRIYGANPTSAADTGERELLDGKLPGTPRVGRTSATTEDTMIKSAKGNLGAPPLTASFQPTLLPSSMLPRRCIPWSETLSPAFETSSDIPSHPLSDALVTIAGPAR